MAWNTGTQGWERILFLVDRRIPHPLECGFIMLDVGSGANPHGNVQIDLYGEESDKHHVRKSVAPTIYASAEHLPFRDEVIDRALCFHILEHLRRPFDALLDIRRVLKRSGHLSKYKSRIIFKRLTGSIRIEEPNPREWAHERREHLYSWHPDTFHNIVRETGFETVIYHQGGRNHSIEAVKK